MKDNILKILKKIKEHIFNSKIKSEDSFNNFSIEYNNVLNFKTASPEKTRNVSYPSLLLQSSIFLIS